MGELQFDQRSHGAGLVEFRRFHGGREGVLRTVLADLRIRCQNSQHFGARIEIPGAGKPNQARRLLRIAGVRSTPDS
jgi:hypothetical protein